MNRRAKDLALALGATSLLLAALNVQRPPPAPHYAEEVLTQCAHLNAPVSTHATHRTESDRFVAGVKPVLITNASLWTGGDNGNEVVQYGDILLDRGIIKAVGNVPRSLLRAYLEDGDIESVNAEHAWITPGIVDIHSHIAVYPSPAAKGTADVDSLLGITQPWLRSLDGMNTHDASYELVVSGGVVASLVLPGSAGAIGGQAFMIKLRPTAERTPDSLLVEAPHGLNGSKIDYTTPPRWRHIKHACGEFPGQTYKGTRPDTNWAFRSAYTKAQKLKLEQDDYCTKARAGKWSQIGPKIPQDLHWEALSDVLRGRVKVHVHCYEAVDLTNFVRLSNEFEFPVAAFHHAHEAYLVPGLLKGTWGGAPGVALFATQARYKREAFRGSEFAPGILAGEGIKVTMKSDHPILNARYLIHEAAQAHYFGLPTNLALASVITTSAEIAGLDHRMGYLKEGYDADVVIWDSHPLALGATPRQVYIDGIPQISNPAIVLKKPPSYQSAPKPPNFHAEAKQALKFDGLPPLTPQKSFSADQKVVVVFKNVSTVWRQVGVERKIERVFEKEEEMGIVLVKGGHIECIGSESTCLPPSISSNDHVEVVDLEGGVLAPGFTSFGSPLGLEEILAEPSSNDGVVYNPYAVKVPRIIRGRDGEEDGMVVQARDGLSFGGRNLLHAYRAGITNAISAPQSSSVGLSGLSVAFLTSSPNALAKGAITQDVAAMHISIGHVGVEDGGPSVSTQIGVLRRMLMKPGEGERGDWVRRVLDGSIPLAIQVEKADHIASILRLKHQIETTNTGASIRLTLIGASEAHLLAPQIAASNNVGVILIPVHPFPLTFDQERILAGPPLGRETSLGVLRRVGVIVGVGVGQVSLVGGTRWDVARAALELDGPISIEETLELASTNIDRLLGVKQGEEEMVAYRGGDMFSMESKVVGVVSAGRGAVDLF